MRRSKDSRQSPEKSAGNPNFDPTPTQGSLKLSATFLETRCGRPAFDLVQPPSSHHWLGDRRRIPGGRLLAKAAVPQNLLHDLGLPSLDEGPDDDIFKVFTEMAARGQKTNNGDRYVGRKFGNYLYNTGFRDIHINIEIVTSQEIGLKKFLDITTGFKMEQIKPEDKKHAKQLLDKIYSNINSPYAFGCLGVFSAVGSKVK